VKINRIGDLAHPSHLTENGLRVVGRASDGLRGKSVPLPVSQKCSRSGWVTWVS